MLEHTTLRVCPYTRPHRFYSCTSPLSTLITHHQRLATARRCSDRADDWNSRPKMVLEHGDKRLINDVANAGQAITLAKTEDNVFTSLFQARSLQLSRKLEPRP